MRFPFLVKLASVGAVAGALLVPIFLTQHKIYERQSQNHQARSSIAEAAAGVQRLTLPLIEHRCRETFTVEKKVRVEGKDEVQRDEVRRETQEREVVCGRIYADALKVQGMIDAEAEPRRRGIFTARLYQARLRVSGALTLTEPDLSGPHQRRLTGTYFAVVLADARGIKNAPQLQFGARKIEFKPGTRLLERRQGVHADLSGLRAAGPQDFSFEIDFLGMENFSIAPLARAAEINLKSNWPHPSFAGNFLPDEKNVSAQGFNAVWKTSEFSTGGRPALDDWAGGQSHGDSGGGTSMRVGDAAGLHASGKEAAALEVRLFEPVNLYSLAHRSAEYAILFIGLTFLIVLAWEFAGAMRVHPMQYGLAGLALAAFFLLLLALAEHIGFARAYAAAGGACTVLLTWYAMGVLGGAWRGLSVGASTGLMFGALYVVLRSEDQAFLLGALLVFTVLAAIMLATRRLDWYGLGARLGAKASA